MTPPAAAADPLTLAAKEFFWRVPWLRVHLIALRRAVAAGVTAEQILRWAEQSAEEIG